MLRRVLPIASALLALACGGEEPAPAPTLTRVQTEIFAVSCALSSCHGEAAPQKGLVLAGATHARIVGVMAQEKPGTVLVSPGQPDASFLLDKMRDRDLPAAPTGERWDAMPPPTGEPSAARVELVRAWIAAGALDD